MFRYLFFIITGMFSCQLSLAQQDTILVNDSSSVDTTAIGILADSSAPKRNSYFESINTLLSDNRFVDHNSPAESMVVSKRVYKSKDLIFYMIAVLFLLFGLLRLFYARYLNNLFRVFFNTSLRQSQLTDQLLQAKLPSLLFNIFFVLSGGIYLYFLLGYLGHIDAVDDLEVLFYCVAALIIVYSVKFIVLKFTGWISGYSGAADTYIFIVFLINKIMAIALLPVIIVMAFSDKPLVNAAVLISLILISLMLVLRFFKSYGILQGKIKVQRYHFFLYIIGIEILPLLLIYKSAMDLLTNNL